MRPPCFWSDKKVTIETANRARCPHCGRRIKIRGYRVWFHRLPGVPG